MIGDLVNEGIDTAVEMSNAFSANSLIIADPNATQADFKNGNAAPGELQVAEGVTMNIPGAVREIKDQSGQTVWQAPNLS